MQVLLDSGIYIHSRFAEPAIRQTSIRWGNRTQTIGIHGFIRKRPPDDAVYRCQIEALFTIGRLIREGSIKAYQYNEIVFERMRDRIGMPVCDALRGCDIHFCETPIIRSRFRQTRNFMDAIAKGGRKDRKAGRIQGAASQVACFEWLCSLRKTQIGTLLSYADKLGLTDFEIESFKHIDWFQFLCRRAGLENSPDIFHLWTAERNGLDGFLTLDKRLANLVRQVRKEKAKTIEIKTMVFEPLDLLIKLGIRTPDPVPIESDRFYHHHEILA